MTNTAARAAVHTALEAQRHSAEQAARPAFETMRASDQAFELIARMQRAKADGDRAKWDAARAELMTLVNEL